MTPLSARRRTELRGEAHQLSPIVIIGDKGLTDEVIAEIDRSLRAHELIKVRAASGERDTRELWLDTICTRLAAHPVQQIGKVFVIYRENPPEEPKAAPRPVAKGAAGNDDRLARAREKQRAKDEKKRRERDIEDMRRKGKIPADAKVAPVELRPPRPVGGGLRPRSGDRGVARKTGARSQVPAGDDVKRASRPKSRTPAPLPESGARRRRSRT